jgi:threonine/homoserine/homoserine lactone efflux protein
MDSIDLPFLLTALVLELTPGPNMAWLALLCAVEGRRAGLAAVAGVAVGLTILGLVAAFGLTELLRASPNLATAMRWAGFAYMLWLAWDTWPHKRQGHSDGTIEARRLVQTFRRGVVLNLLNPKSALVFVVIVPEFFHPTLPVFAQALALSAVYVAIATVVHGAIVLLAAQLHKWLTSGTHLGLVQRGFALLLVVIALWIITRG